MEPNIVSWALALFVNPSIMSALRGEIPTPFPDWGMSASEASRIFEREWQAELSLISGASSDGSVGSASITRGATATSIGGGGGDSAARTAAAGKSPSLARALWRAFRGQFLLAAALKLLWGFFVLVSVSYFVRALLSYIRFRSTDVDHTKEEELVGIGLCLGFLVCMLLLSTALQQMSIVSARLGQRVESAMATAVYKKSLTYDRAANKADILPLVSNDCAKLNAACTMLQYLWSGAVEAFAILLILIGFVGRAALPGLGVVVLLVPTQFFLGLAMANARTATVAAADRRVAFSDEVLRSIKLVKMYCWEAMFARSVAAERSREVSIQVYAAGLKSVNFAVVFVAPPLIALSIFGIFTLEAPLEASLAFTTLSLFNTLRLPLVLLPKGLTAMVEARMSVARLLAFLLLPDSPAVRAVAGSGGGDAALKSGDVPQSTLPRGTLECVGASFAYGAAAPAILKDVSLRCDAGSMTAVTGPVGSGKSNLVLALLNQMTKVGGVARSEGSFAFVPQTPWCAHGTVRENITFGSAWDEARYRNVLWACALERDLELFDNGDLTEIGERGMNISGGQRQRIAIARAVYARADVVILDSPLSAVDA
jgi:ATP-binding cassette subfamily C (CFTR/MRP) protein 1